MSLGGAEEEEGQDDEEEGNANSPEGILLEDDYDEGANKPPDPEEQVEHLQPVVLIRPREQLEYAEVAEDVEHAGAGRADEHADEEVPEGEAEGADQQGGSHQDDLKDEKGVVLVLLGEDFDDLPSREVAQPPRQEYKCEVGLVLASDSAEVEDDGAHSRHHRAVEDVEHRINREVNVL